MKKPDVHLPPYKVQYPPAQELLSRARYRSWAVEFLRANLIWEKGFTGKGTVFFTVDTEDTATHPDVVPVMVRAYNRRWTNEPVSAAGFARKSVESEGLHGLHVADSFRQCAPGALIAFQKVLTNAGSGYSTWVAEGIRAAADMKFLPEHKGFRRIINLSLGSNAGSIVIREAIAYAKEKACFICAAGGNDGRDGDNSVDYPGRWDDLCITSGALDYKKEQVADFSSWGPLGAIDLAAPGVRVRAAYKDGYADLSGTSMASPNTAAVVALILEAFPNIRTQDELEAFLIESATDIAEPGEDLKSGAGIPYATNYISTTPVPPPPPDDNPPPEKPDRTPFFFTWWPFIALAGIAAGMIALKAHWVFWIAWGLVLAFAALVKGLSNWKINF